jgi:hypothetical protein
MSRTTGPRRQWTFVVDRPVDEALEGDDDAGAFVEGMPPCLEVVVAEEQIGRGRSPTLKLTLDLRTLPPVVTSITITAEHGVTAELLRSLPLSRLAKYATLGTLAMFGKDPLRGELWSRLSPDRSGFYGFPTDPQPPPPILTLRVDDGAAAQKTLTDSWSELVKHHDQASDRRRRNVVSDELLQRVADVYRQAMEARRPPKKAVQQAESVSAATAGRYITRARARGYLGQTARGKKGEEGK